MAFSATIRAAIAATLTSAADMGSPTHDFSEASAMSFTEGTGADQANNVFSDERTLAASATENLDLAGVLANAFGATVTAAAVKAIMIEAAAGNTNNVVVGGAASFAFVGPFSDATDKIVLGPGDVFLVTRRSATGMAVTAGTGDILLVANSGSGTGVTYRVVLVVEV